MSRQEQRYSNQQSSSAFQPQSYRQSGVDRMNPGRNAMHSSSDSHSLVERINDRPQSSTSSALSGSSSSNRFQLQIEGLEDTSNQPNTSHKPDDHSVNTLSPRPHRSSDRIDTNPSQSSDRINANPIQKSQMYTIQSGDTLWSIAQESLGDGNRWQELEKKDGSHFTTQDATQLKVGDSVFITGSTQERLTPAPKAKTPTQKDKPLSTADRNEQASIDRMQRADAVRDSNLSSENRIEKYDSLKEQWAKADAMADQVEARVAFENYPEVKGATGRAIPFFRQGNDPSKISVGVAHNMRELGVASLTNKEVVYLQGELLNAIKKDPDMVKFEKEIVQQLKQDERYGKQSFTTYDKRLLTFGGERWQSKDEIWLPDPREGESLSRSPFAHGKTWDTGTNELTWALRHASVVYKADVDSNGNIQIQHHLWDTLDLTPQEGREEAYNKISEWTGVPYHDVLGGNKNLQTRAEWTTTL